MAPGIIAIDYFLPERVETNTDLSDQNPTWLMERLEEKCGIYSRHVAGPDETACDLGYEAAEKLLQRQLVPNDEIDFLLDGSVDKMIPHRCWSQRITHQRLRNPSGPSPQMNIACTKNPYAHKKSLPQVVHNQPGQNLFSRQNLFFASNGLYICRKEQACNCLLQFLV